jgi:hypothetical protein
MENFVGPAASAVTIGMFGSEWCESLSLSLHRLSRSLLHMHTYLAGRTSRRSSTGAPWGRSRTSPRSRCWPTASCGWTTASWSEIPIFSSPTLSARCLRAITCTPTPATAPLKLGYFISLSCREIPFGLIVCVGPTDLPCHRCSLCPLPPLLVRSLDCRFSCKRSLLHSSSPFDRFFLTMFFLRDHYPWLLCMQLFHLHVRLAAFLFGLFVVILPFLCGKQLILFLSETCEGTPKQFATLSPAHRHVCPLLVLVVALRLLDL